MDDWHSYNRETKAERDARHQRARDITSGSRGADSYAAPAGYHLTAKEYALLTELRKQGITITSGVLVDERHNRTWQHARIVQMERSA
jgi:hypothetical protein